MWAIVLVIFLIFLFKEVIQLGDVSIKKAEVEKQLWKERADYFQILDKQCNGRGYKIENQNLICNPPEGK